MNGHRVIWPPLETEDGRTYDVQNVTLQIREHEDVPYLCTVSLMERRDRFQYIEFLMFFHRNHFAQGKCDDKPIEVVHCAHAWLLNWLESHPLRPSCADSERAIIVEFD